MIARIRNISIMMMSKRPPVNSCMRNLLLSNKRLIYVCFLIKTCSFLCILKMHYQGSPLIITGLVLKWNVFKILGEIGIFP